MMKLCRSIAAALVLSAVAGSAARAEQVQTGSEESFPVAAQINAPRPVTAIDPTNDVVPSTDWAPMKARSRTNADAGETGDPNSVDYRNRGISSD
jgi:hypothetical protein